MPPDENFGIQDLQDRICWVSGQVTVAKITHISRIQEAFSLLFSVYFHSLKCKKKLVLEIMTVDVPY